MKRLMFGGLVVLGLALTAAPVKADCYFESSCCRHMCFVRTSRNRCWTFNSHVNPLPCMSHSGGGSSGPAPWNALAAYGPYGYPPPYRAPLAAARPAAAPATPAPAAAPKFNAPQPTPAANKQTGVQQAGYVYYGQTNNAGYGYNAGYNYGAGYGYGYYGYGAGYSYAQVPNYWY